MKTPITTTVVARKKLVDARKKLDITQEELANRVNISRGYLSNVEKGKHTPSLKTASKLAKELNMTMEELFLQP
ncbi:helix-turn-helix transcriptional regulator [Halobacillus karajensis]|uniref:helix-turn-helix transcriptional regulator n=1 Tax=Halobacillus karajensis TaxID=195088 RepID=UPI00045D037A|nr:helix-turn-helix transcriptional regulator [Halobacillus karajensis]CDQ17978.1 transcription factor [Halobacillus karajensis]